LNCGSEGTCALTCHTDGGGGGGVCINLDVVCGNDACTAACTGSGNPNGFTFDANQSCGASNGC
jgi:hypothetical protein